MWINSKTKTCWNHAGKTINPPGTKTTAGATDFICITTLRTESQHKLPASKLYKVSWCKLSSSTGKTEHLLVKSVSWEQQQKNQLGVIKIVRTFLLSTGEQVWQRQGGFSYQPDESGFLKKGSAKVHVLHHRQFNLKQKLGTVLLLPC